jgi:hypothetical protein
MNVSLVWRIRERQIVCRDHKLIHEFVSLVD